MSAANKRKGAEWETTLMKFLRTEGYDVERLRLAGKDDEGDLVIKHGGLVYIIEAKNTAKIDHAQFVREAELEAVNYKKHRSLDFMPNFASIVKRRNAHVGEAYVLLPLHEWLAQINDTVRKPF